MLFLRISMCSTRKMVILLAMDFPKRVTVSQLSDLDRLVELGKKNDTAEICRREWWKA